jgi:hypothetical protein
MRIALVWLAVWFLMASSAHAQSVPAYSILRENEDWSVLRDKSLRQDIWDPLKYIRLGSEDWYLTIGGEVREVFEQVGNDNWGKQPYTNAFFLERYMLHMASRSTLPCVRAVEKRSGILSGRWTKAD